MRPGESERAGDDEREEYDAMRERKVMGDVGLLIGLRYMPANAPDRSPWGIGIDKPGVRAGVGDEAGNDVA